MEGCKALLLTMSVYLYLVRSLEAFVDLSRIVSKISLENTPENISKIFDAFEEASVNIDMISQTIMDDGGLNLFGQGEIHLCSGRGI